jgi:MinD-like ATPase involved in chromosome partitioning or flagellar assembly
MLISGPGDTSEPEGGPEPGGPARPSAHGSPHGGTPGWPSSGLPPSFGQPPVAGERPAFTGYGQPPAGAAYGGHRPLSPPSQAPAEPGSPGPGSPGPGQAWAAPAGYGVAGGSPRPGPQDYGFVGYGGLSPAAPADTGAAEPASGVPPAPETVQPRGWSTPAPSFGPCETYEAEVGQARAVGDGAAGGQETAEPPGPAPGRGRPGKHAAAENYLAPDDGVRLDGYAPLGGEYLAPDDGVRFDVYSPPAGYAGGPAGGYGPAGAYRPADAAVAGHVPSGDDGGVPAPGGYGVVVPDVPSPRYPEGPTRQGVSADGLAADLLLPGRHSAPRPGWRRALYRVSGGLVRAPQPAADQRRMDLVVRACTPVAAGHHRVAVLSLKGGVGKTTTAVGLGATLASLRGDRVIAVDANPDRGTLCDKLRLETAATVRDLLNEEGQIRRYADVRAYTTQAASGLEVLASDRDPAVSVAFSDEDYEDVAQILEHYYSVCVTDCGTGLLHSAMAGVLRLADQIVLVSSPSVDGARSASATLDWLAAHQYGDLVRGAVVVLSAIRPHSKSTVDLARLEQHFGARCRAVVRIPYDAHLEEGAEMDLARLSRATAESYLVLAAEVGDGFARPRR